LSVDSRSDVSSRPTHLANACRSMLLDPRRQSCTLLGPERDRPSLFFSFMSIRV
jgi:hypothetical protein